MSTPTRSLVAALVAALVTLLPRPAVAQPVPYLGPIDVAFAIDDTGSMVDALASLNTALPGILDRIERGSDPGTGAPDYRLALVTFKDDLTIRVNFSDNNRDAFTLAAAVLTASAGGALPEASDEALNTIIHALAQRPHQNTDFAPAFRPDALRVIVLLTDTLPGGFDDLATLEDVANAHARAGEAAAAGIKIAAIFTPLTDATEQTAQDVMKFYATATGGVYAKVAPVDAGNAILQYFAGAPALNRPPIAVCAPVIDTVSCPADANVDGGSRDPDGTIVSTAQAPPGPYDQPTTDVVLTVTDNLGAIATCQTTVTATLCGPQPPTIQAPTLISVEATGPSGAVATFEVTAADDQGNVVPVSCLPESGSLFALGQSTVTCIATDTHNLSKSETFTVEVVDTTPPTLHLPGNAAIDATAPAGAAYTYSATAADLVDGPVAVSCTRDSGAVFVVGTTTVSCTAIDVHSNSAAGSFTVTVVLVDHVAPVVSVPGTMTAEAVGPAGAPVTFAASATDNLDPSVGVTCAPASKSTFPLGATTVTCQATDAHGNAGTASFIVTVVDTTAPAVSVPPNQTLQANGAAGAAFPFTATAADVVDGAIAPVCSPPSGFVFPVGTTPVTCTASDSHGNARHASFTVTVNWDVVVPPRVWCERGRNPGGREPQGEDGFVQVEATAASDAAPFSIALGRFALANHETIKITRTGARSEVRLVSSANGIRHFQVPDDFEIVLMDRAGRRATSACRDDDGHDRDRDRDHDRDRDR
jgi:hypothetical protein